MRRTYFVCYDIRDPKRLRHVFRTMKGYGEHWQYSVFLCRLKPIDRVRMQHDLEGDINIDDDQIIVVDIGPSDGRAEQAISVIGQRLPELDENVIVI